MTHPTPEPGGSAFHNAKDAKAHQKAAKAYQKASRPWFKKKRTWALGLLLLIVLASCLGSQGGSSADPSTGDTAVGNPTSAAPENAFPGQESGDVVGSAGDTLALGDVSVTTGPIAPGDNTLGATLCTPVTLQNNSDDTVNFNLMDWQLQSPGGTILNAGFTGADDIPAGGEIAPGGSTSGTVCFDADNTETGQYVVLYEPTFSFSTDRGAWLNTQ
jgi:hypothetical protein